MDWHFMKHREISQKKNVNLKKENKESMASKSTLAK